MAIIIKATLDAKRVGSYDGREFVILQIVERDERGGLQLIEVNLPDGADHTPYVQGKLVEIAVTISFSKKNGKIYYRAVLPASKAAA